MSIHSSKLNSFSFVLPFIQQSPAFIVLIIKPQVTPVHLPVVGGCNSMEALSFPMFAATGSFFDLCAVMIQTDLYEVQEQNMIRHVFYKSYYYNLKPDYQHDNLISISAQHCVTKQMIIIV